jgi:diguanylate cyclase (GGDEF)-like protein/PAS domain S-box-containing protein
MSHALSGFLARDAGVISQSASAEVHRPLKVLLIEDNPGDADLVRDRLDGGTDTRFEFAWAQTLESGRDLLAQGGIDLVLLDLSLPDSHGLDTFRAVNSKAPQLPIVILTGLDDEDMAMQTLQEGGQDFLSKSQATPELLERMVRYSVERKRAEVSLLRSEERFRTLFETIPHAICVVFRGTEAFIAVNQAAISHYGYSKEEFLSMSMLDLSPPDLVAEVSAWLRANDFRAPLRTRHRRKIDGDVDVEMMVGDVDFAGEPARFAIITDISERKLAEERLEYQASHDSLTDLPNRAFLRSQVERMAASARTDNARPFAFLLLDLDRFKEINDSLGHRCGDLVLQHLSPRLRACIRRSDTVARLGGDEFAILLPGASAKEATLVAEKIETALRAPILVDGHSLTVEASIGMSLYPGNGHDWDTLIQRADIAMYGAKHARCGHLLFSEDRSQDPLDRLELAQELRAAIERSELELHYQPKIDLVTMCVHGVEALIRWQHPRKGFVPATHIIALAEHAGLMKSLGQWVFSTAAEQSTDWCRMGIDLEIAINLAAQNLQDPELMSAVFERVGNRDKSRLRLMLEITESAMLQDPEGSRLNLDRLHDLGVKISIDDFGTGYSSLSYLKELPVDEVKIDQSFVQNMAGSPRDSCIVRTVIELGHNLGLRVVAEGVEDASVLGILSQLRCDVAQGYYLSHPLPRHNLECWYGDAKSKNIWVPAAFGN